MDTNERKSDELLAKESYEIIGFSMKLLNAIGHGFHEKIYENGLVVDFEKNSINYTQQPNYDIEYEGELLGKYIPDLVVRNEIIVDTKTIDEITDREKGQMLNYLKVTGLQLGLIINFKHSKLEWKRVVLSDEHPS